MDNSETGVQELTGEDIIGMVQVSSSLIDEREEEEENKLPTITHSETEEAFSIGLSWRDKQSEATQMKIVLLHELHTLLAVKKKHDSLKQTHNTDFANLKYRIMKNKIQYTMYAYSNRPLNHSSFFLMLGI